MIVFKEQLTEGLLLKRYKRFFADVEYYDPRSDKKIALTIHCPNTGSLKSVIEKETEQPCWFSISSDPKRKLKGTLEAVQIQSGAWVGVNTAWPNKMIQFVAMQTIESKKPFFKTWENYGFYKAEHKISKETRLDGVFCYHESHLADENQMKHFIEIKNVSLKTDNHAQFPDAVTERGQKHLKDLIQLVKNGHKSELIFIIQRSDIDAFSIAKQIDPTYHKLFDLAVNAGVIMTPVLAEISRTGIKLSSEILAMT